ncbi:type II secretion system F family protein [Desulfitobacterium hafniense]|uniref:type II secretion system F family protein n=1 Tax=Desulfitobacterium hafniense TaxID=49338 RepID=UPI000367A201|nr:type II secretion system F family protein [Desulfitobacterium hafniense]
MLGYQIFFILGGMTLAYVFYEIFKRTRKVPLAILVARQENAPLKVDVTKKENSFNKRAERVGWAVGRNYLEFMLMLGVVIGGVAAFYFKTWVPLVVGIAAGMFYPYYKLSQKEELYFDELPTRADQALGAVEQQIDSDIPIFDALKQAVPYMQQPLRQKYEKVTEKVEKTGMPLKRALEGIPEELGLAQLEYFHIILEVAEETEEKAREIISDASDTIRRQQKQANRLKREIAMSKSEMKMMFVLVLVMVASFSFMLPDTVPIKGTIIQKGLNIAVIGISGWTTWATLKKIQAKNLF